MGVSFCRPSILLDRLFFPVLFTKCPLQRSLTANHRKPPDLTLTSPLRKKCTLLPFIQTYSEITITVFVTRYLIKSTFSDD